MSRNVRTFIYYWLPLLAWLSVIFLASTDMMSAEHTSRFIGPFLRWLIPDISSATIAQVQFFVRKGAHVTEYAILGALLARAFLHSFASVTTRHAFPIWLLCTTAAAGDEFHQSFVSSRTASPIDVLIDSAGALLGLTVYLTLRKWRGRARARPKRPGKWA